MSALEILGRAVARLNRAIAEIIPELPAFGDPEEHAEATARALLAEVERLRRERDEAREVYDALLGDPLADVVVHLATGVAVLERERDEARAQRNAALKERNAAQHAVDEMAVQHARIVAERDEARAYLAALREDAEHLCDRLLSGDDGCIDESIRCASDLRAHFVDIEAAVREHEARLRAEVQRAEQERDGARAHLAALREAVMTLEWGTAARACSDLAASAREHETRIRAKALREAADVCDARGEATRYPSELGPQKWNPSGTVLTEAGAAWCDAARKLRAMADEAEKGGE